MSEREPNIHQLSYDQLLSDPRNPNRMPSDRFSAMRAHIEKTGNCPIPLARQLPHTSAYFQKKAGPVQHMLLDGHHRVRVLRELGFEIGPVDIWGEMSDADAGIYLLTLNRNVGEDDPMARASLITDIQKSISLSDIALVVPETMADLSALMDMRQVSLEITLGSDPELAEPEPDVIADVDNETAIPVRFALFPGQHKVVMMALLHIQGDMEGRNKPARALEEMSADFLSGLSNEERIRAEILYLASMDENGELAETPESDDDAQVGFQEDDREELSLSTSEDE